ncbi:phytoene/squalene synthase family protein [bacterium]|nr:MAG: phytoene/squalene synthase family protein [bacterium]
MAEGGSKETAVGRFASEADHAECRRLHRKYGTTYYFATQRFPAPIRRRVHALYGFVRVPDEWVDNPAHTSRSAQLQALSDYRAQLLRGLEGVRPDEPVLRAFCDVAGEVKMPLDEPLLFLDAMEMDLSIDRYDTYQDLRGYMRGSASAVGMMMCSALEAGDDPQMLKAAQSLGEAMQLTNFLRDVAEDAVRGRIYLPREDMRSFGVTEEEVLAGAVSERFLHLMRFEIARARALYALADAGIPMLPPCAHKAVRLARVLYSRILDRLEAQGCDPFQGRVRTSTPEKLQIATRIVLGLRA